MLNYIKINYNLLNRKLQGDEEVITVNKNL